VARPVSTPVGTDRRLLQLAEQDNVLIVVATIEAGQTYTVRGSAVTATEALPLGFKVAAADLESGTVAIRYGTPIGRTTRPVGRGELIHTHNLESLYMRTHERGEA